MAEEEAVKCNGCGQTWSVREFGKGCPSCKPQVVGKRDKRRRLMGTVMEAQGADTAGARGQTVALTPLAPDEPQTSP